MRSITTEGKVREKRIIDGSHLNNVKNVHTPHL